MLLPSSVPSRLSPMSADVAHQAFAQQLIGTGGEDKGDIEALRIYNSNPTTRTLFLMVLEAHPTGSAPRVDASIEDDELVLQTPTGEMRWRLDPDRSDRTDPVLVIPGGEEEDGTSGDDGGDAGVGDDAGEDAGDGSDAGIDAADDAGGADDSGGTVGGSCNCGDDRGSLLVLPLLVLILARFRKYY